MDTASEQTPKPNNDGNETQEPGLLSRKKRTKGGSKQERGQNSFQFVNVTEQPRHGAGDQTVIRSQAMRSYLQTEKVSSQGDTEKGQELPAGDEKSSKTQHRFRLGPWGIQELVVKPRKPRGRRKLGGLETETQIIHDNIAHVAENGPLQHLVLGRPEASIGFPVQATFHTWALDGGKIDPFDSLPIPASERIQFLLNYSHSQITSSPLMTYPKKSWFWLACKDPAYFHAALSHYSGHLNLSRQCGDPEEALVHRMKSMNIINDRLTTSDLATSDGTIGAISCILNYEANNGTLESVRTHVIGLEQMVKLRGGLQNGGFSTNLHRLVVWADINSANALSTLPLFPPIDESAPYSDSAPPPCTTGPPSTRDSRLSKITGLQEILADLRCLSSVFPRGDLRLSWRTDSMWYADILYYCKRSLIFLSHTTPQDRDSKMDVVYSHAAAILVEVCFRGVGINARIVDTLLARLKGSLDVAFLDEWILGEYAKARELFWALCVGGIAAVRRPEGSWFVKHATRLAGELNVGCWRDAENILESVLWHSDWGLPHEAFWVALNS